jgi:hypothetical protein
LKKKVVPIFLIIIITSIVLLSSCEFIIPKSIPLFIKIQDNYAWVSQNTSITFSFYTNYDVSDCNIKINDDSITEKNVVSSSSTSIEYDSSLINTKKYTINLSNYTKVSTNDGSFKLSITIARGNETKDLSQDIYFGKLIKKSIVKKEDIQSTYSVYELYAPEKLDNLTITSTVIVKTESKTPIISVNGGLNVNGGSLIFNTNSNPLTLTASGNSWEGIRLTNNGTFSYNSAKLYIIRANPGIYISSSNREYSFENIIFRNDLGSANTGIYNESSSEITISNSSFDYCGSPIINYGSGSLKIENCDFENQSKALEVYGNTTIENSTFKNLSQKSNAITYSGTNITFTASPAIIIGNDFTMDKSIIEGHTVGLYIKNDVNELNINDNSFNGNTVSIFVNANIVKTPNIGISKNIISGRTTTWSTPDHISSLSGLKDCGIVLKDCDGSMFEKNLIKDYSYGVAIFDDGPTNFYSDDNVGNDIINSNVYSMSSADFSHTYWGTTNATDIKKRLYPEDNITFSPVATTSNFSN